MYRFYCPCLTLLQCDETKPTCKRCTDYGTACDYDRGPVSSVSALKQHDGLLQPLARGSGSFRFEVQFTSQKPLRLGDNQRQKQQQQQPPKQQPPQPQSQALTLPSAPSEGLAVLGIINGIDNGRDVFESTSFSTVSNPSISDNTTSGTSGVGSAFANFVVSPPDSPSPSPPYAAYSNLNTAATYNGGRHFSPRDLELLHRFHTRTSASLGSREDHPIFREAYTRLTFTVS